MTQAISLFSLYAYKVPPLSPDAPSYKLPTSSFLYLFFSNMITHKYRTNKKYSNSKCRIPQPHRYLYRSSLLEEDNLCPTGRCSCQTCPLRSRILYRKPDTKLILWIGHLVFSAVLLRISISSSHRLPLLDPSSCIPWSYPIPTPRRFICTPQYSLEIRRRIYHINTHQIGSGKLHHARLYSIAFFRTRLLFHKFSNLERFSLICRGRVFVSWLKLYN